MPKKPTLKKGKIRIEKKKKEKVIIEINQNTTKSCSIQDYSFNAYNHEEFLERIKEYE
jgi:hypothetical protein